MSKLIKVTHLTSAHSRYDTRIFLKMCSSLAKNKTYEVTLVVADGNGDECKNNVHIIDIGEKQGGRISRMTTTTKKILEKSLELKSDIYHLHDPELIPLGVKLKRLEKKIIFDSHEDVGKDILSKEWIPALLRKSIASIYDRYERYACAKFDAIITATPFIRDKFLNINKNSIDINNFPILGELSNSVKWEDKKDEVCYVGGIAKIRGIKEVVQAMHSVGNIRLNLAGIFSDKDVEKEVKNYDGWKNVNELGFLNREEVAIVLGSSKAGIVTFYPLLNHIDAQPNKMFEYMSAGLPLITSNFPFWKEIVEGNKCGICVNPLESKEIADAINYIISNPKEASQMGENGRKSVLEKYNWGIEEKKLFETYEGLRK